MIDYNDYFINEISTLKEEGRYRIFRDIARNAGNFPHATYYLQGQEKNIVIWCGVDYLGMGQHHTVKTAMIDAIQNIGTGSGGSRNIGGNCHLHVLLEQELANLHCKDRALLFSSGYVANQATLVTIGKVIPNCIYLSDAANHASIIEGIRSSQCEKRIFKHNDLEDLERQLKAIPLDRPKMIVFEALYSMDGDTAPVREIVQLAEQYNAMTYIDEVHTVGIYGETAAGFAEHEGVADKITIVQGTLAKGFGVCGGYIAGSEPMVDAIRCLASAFIFTVSLPPAVSAGALASIKYLRTHDRKRKKLLENAALLKEKFKAAGLPVMQNHSYIIPVLIGNANLCNAVSFRLLEEFGLYIQPINFPTVPRGTERLRITPTPQHTEQDMDTLVQALKIVITDLTKNHEKENFHEADTIS